MYTIYKHTKNIQTYKNTKYTKCKQFTKYIKSTTYIYIYTKYTTYTNM